MQEAQIAPGLATSLAGSVADSLTDALVQDTQRVFQQMGLQTLRISLLKQGSADAQSSCLIGEQGDLQEADVQRQVDSVFPGGAAHLEELMNRPELFTSVRKLSPRHWLLAWRLHDGHAVVADAKFHDKRDVLSDADAATIRLVCNTSFGRLRADVEEDASGAATAQVWPHVERRKLSGPARPPWLSLALLSLIALCSAWLLFMALPQTQRNEQALRAEFNRLRDGTMTKGLSTALATGDYGEVQLVLQNFFDLGQFQSAVVTNDKQRAIAMTGTLKNQRIGEPVAPGFVASATAIKLSTGSQQHGELLYEPAPASSSSTPAGAHVLTWAAALALLCSVVLLVQQLMGLRRS
jgi:plasmid stabilization system protein ParE